MKVNLTIDSITSEEMERICANLLWEYDEQQDKITCDFKDELYAEISAKTFTEALTAALDKLILDDEIGSLRTITNALLYDDWEDACFYDTLRSAIFSEITVRLSSRPSDTSTPKAADVITTTNKYILCETIERNISTPALFGSHEEAYTEMVKRFNEADVHHNGELGENMAYCENANHDNCDWAIFPLE